MCRLLVFHSSFGFKKKRHDARFVDFVACTSTFFFSCAYDVYMPVCVCVCVCRAKGGKKKKKRIKEKKEPSRWQFVFFFFHVCGFPYFIYLFLFLRATSFSQKRLLTIACLVFFF